MQVSAISSSNSASAAAAATSSRLPVKALGQADFLKLLAVQFQKQDPMKPIEDTSFIAQMAQFTALDQTGAMSRDLAALRSDQQRAMAAGCLGRVATVDAGDGTTAAGLVSAIDVTGSTPQLVIGGVSYPLAALLRVEPGTVTTPTPQPATTGGAQ